MQIASRDFERCEALPQQGLAYAIKRVIDTIGALVLGLLALPLLLLLGLAIKLDSPGPVFFGHTRIGLKGKKFRAWKLRTMVTNAADMLDQHLANSAAARKEWHRNQKLSHDPRVTRLGNFLRKSSLDELPQLWNVLAGEMSLVGPRPIVQEELHHYGQHSFLYESVLPGLSGLWQISGRSDVSYERRVALDVYYIKQWTLGLDFKIILLTIPALIYRRGAR